MSEILPCPFCGSNDVEVKDGESYVTCNQCETYGPYAGRVGDHKAADFVELWNAALRPIDPAVAFADMIPKFEMFPYKIVRDWAIDAFRAGQENQKSTTK